MKLDVRYSHHPEDFKKYTTKELRDHFLIKEVFIPDEVSLVYSHYDRIIAGGIMPVTKTLELESGKELASSYFLELREMGVINIGGKGYILLDGVKLEMDYQDGIYIGKGTKDIKFGSDDSSNPAKFYMNSSPAHKEYPTVHIPL